VKTKHPQLHYESKLYMLLQGGCKCHLQTSIIIIVELSRFAMIHCICFFANN